MSHTALIYPSQPTPTSCLPFYFCWNGVIYLIYQVGNIGYSWVLSPSHTISLSVLRILSHCIMASSPALCCLLAFTCPCSSDPNWPFSHYCLLSSFTGVNLQAESEEAPPLSKSSVIHIERRCSMANTVRAQTWTRLPGFQPQLYNVLAGWAQVVYLTCLCNDLSPQAVVGVRSQ